MIEMNFCITNLIVGIGSFSQQFHTRDTLKQAFKATAVKINGQWIDIFKDPKTDNSGKKSAKGLLKVYWQDAGTKNAKIVLKDQCTSEEENQGLLETIFENGSFIKRTTLTEIRERISNSI